MIFLVVLMAKPVRRMIEARKAESASASRSRPSVLVGAGAPQ